MPEIHGVQVPFLPAGGMQELRRDSSLPRINEGKSDFNEILANELTNLKFSGHAQSRLNSRELNLDAQDIIKLEGAVDKARDKGANETLVLLKDKAFIVSVRNQTVITVMNRDQMDSSVITNIDSAVIA